MLIRCNGSRCDLESRQPHSSYRSSVISKFLKISEELYEDVSEDDFRPVQMFNFGNDNNGDDDNNANEVLEARANHMEGANEENVMAEIEQMFRQMFSEVGDDLVLTQVTAEITYQALHCRIHFYYTNDYLLYCVPCFMGEQLLAHEDFNMVRCHRAETYEILLAEQHILCVKCENPLAIIINSDMCQLCNP
ncbi:hypothetical protein PUN28_016891 [Cardiocondyla obscurior]|uniref:Uncharacterized protein n=1 Tax=Cardiocondyla obscurior TaxID=286306 RepID=A0AAW2EQW6_9HYME